MFATIAESKNRRLHTMLGFADFWTMLGFVLTIGSALLCVTWGIIFWNREN